MKYQNWPLHTHLAILQQCEYDLNLYDQWLTSEHVLSTEVLRKLKPESYTAKLKLIAAKAKALQIIIPTHQAIKTAVSVLSPVEHVAKSSLVWRAQQHLQKLQENGLVVIGIAGSYGKTSVKHQLRHFLSTQHMVMMSPASYNTPLGLASSILKLTSKHDVFIAEMGEYNQGDINDLLNFLKPDIGILTPVGFAHEERFGSSQKLTETFTELWRSADAPDLILIDDANRALYETVPNNVYWYGEEKESDLRLIESKVDLQGGTGTLVFAERTKIPFTTNLINMTQLRNALPAFLIIQSFQQPIEDAVAALNFVPPTSRRLELHKNANGTFVMDNSYNTNPGSWKALLPTLTSLSKSGLVVLTPGFVELDETVSKKEHTLMAQDLIGLRSTIGIVKTRFNKELLETLQKHLPKETFFVGDSYDDLLAQLSTKAIPLTYLWLEGGVREMYQ